MTEPTECPVCGTPFFVHKCKGCGYDENDNDATESDIY